MPLTQHLDRRHVVDLLGSTREQVLHELAERVSPDLAGFDTGRILEAVEAREREIGTAIDPGIALPHARLPGLNRFVIAVGRSRKGVAWGPSVPDPVHLVVMLLGGEEAPREHIRILAALASALRRPCLLDDVRDAPTPNALYDLLARAGPVGSRVGDDTDRRHSRVLFDHACAVAEETGAAALILHADDRLDPGEFVRLVPGLRLILATHRVPKGSEPRDLFDAVLDVPEAGVADTHRVEFDLVLALSQGLLDDLERIVCVWGRSHTGRLDSVSVVDIHEDFHVLMSLRSELRTSDIAPAVLNRVMGIASALATEGREGKPIGTILVVGDYEQVATHCQQMVINPFFGYADEQKSILDPSLEETVKEFAAIDGAFVLRGDGVLMSAGTYLSAEGLGLDVPKGLGTRHTAAAAITSVTSSLALVISESTGAVSLFMRGKQLLVLRRK